MLIQGVTKGYAHEEMVRERVREREIYNFVLFRLSFQPSLKEWWNWYRYIRGYYPKSCTWPLHKTSRQDHITKFGRLQLIWLLLSLLQRLFVKIKSIFNFTAYTYMVRYSWVYTQYSHDLHTNIWYPDGNFGISFKILIEETINLLLWCAFHSLDTSKWVSVCKEVMCLGTQFTVFCDAWRNYCWHYWYDSWSYNVWYY